MSQNNYNDSMLKTPLLSLINLSSKKLGYSNQCKICLCNTKLVVSLFKYLWKNKLWDVFYEDWHNLQVVGWKRSIFDRSI